MIRIWKAQVFMGLVDNYGDVPYSESARNGSLVITDQGKFYLSISAGQLQLDNETIFAISAVSPIGKMLLGKQKGSSFDFNGKKYLIKEGTNKTYFLQERYK